ncbi:hypothetical surface-anchored protein [Coprobacillus sp. CAG:698]|nr:hypothetical surface-anchored protein [Coprobacillus sp. CAG:698]
MMVDEDQKVLSVSALNDDGSIIISGEEIVGKDVEEATKLILELSTETGYIVKGEITSTDNTINITVSGNTEYAEKLANKIIDSGNKALEKLGIEAKLNKVKAMAVAELKKLVLENSTFTEAEVEAMTEEELLKALVVGRMETAILISEDLKKVYFEAKAYEIKFAEKEATKKIIKEIDGVSQILVGTYSTLLTGYREFITSLEDLKYDTLISPDSEYQILLAKVREAKAKYLEQRSFVLTLEAGDVKVKAEVELNNLKKAYEDLEKLLVECGNAAVKSFDYTINKLKEAEVALTEVENKLKSVDVEKVLTEKTQEIENVINSTKNEFFDKFEKAHKEDIEKVEADFIAKKEELKKSIIAK